ncbi:AraC family transcriptional regulator [Nocardia sp. NPDC020380]|uniref:helix-turn-helix domain-containing protein n=1 Tax=Nocardia sp. NPDC020380 TaxID=3364309 RepID=UPI0037914AE1
MNGSQFVEVRRAELYSQDAEETVEFVSSVYADNDLRFRKVPAQSRVRTVATMCGEIMATEIRSTLGYSCEIDALRDQIYFQRTLRGRMRLRGGRHDIGQRRNDLAVYPFGSAMIADCDNHDVNLLHIPHQAITEAAAESGNDSAAVEFTSLIPLDPRRERFWGRLFDLVHHELTEPDSPVLTELVVQNLIRSLASAALTVFPNTTMDPQQSGPGIVPNSALRKAVDYIEAHPTRPITVTELAEHAGISVRALRYEFQNHYDTTPLGYLRRVRLERAHSGTARAQPYAIDRRRGYCGSPAWSRRT